jgi:hypothetical protein
MLELSWPPQSRSAGASVGRRAAVVGAAAAVAVAYVLGWHALVDADEQRLNTDLAFQLSYQSVSWKMFLAGIAGFDYVPEARHWAFVASGLCWFAAYTVWRRPRNVVTWLTCGGLICANFLMTSLSRLRTESFGLFIALLGDRYYFEAVYPLALFGAVAVANTRAAAPVIPFSPSSRRRFALLSCAAVAAIATNAGASTSDLFRRNYRWHEQCRSYLNRYHHDIVALAARSKRPLTIAQAPLPSFLGLDRNRGRQSLLAKISGIDARVRTARRARYRVTDSGRIAELSHRK